MDLRTILAALATPFVPAWIAGTSMLPTQAAPCITSALSVRSLGVDNFWADRSAANRFDLPWRDTDSPVVVTDPVLCRRAARAYAEDSLHTSPDSTLAATVVRAGGLYFVRARPVRTTGEFELTALMDEQFRLLKFLTN